MKIFYSFSVVLAVLVFSGCGSSGGSSEGDAPVSSKSYIVSTGDGPQNISLSPAQAIITEGSCTNTQIYGADGASYGRNTNLAAGEYTVVFSEYFTKYSDSNSALYYLTSGISLSEISLNVEIGIANRSVVLQRLTVSIESHYVISQKNATVKVFNQNLGLLINTNTLESNSPMGVYAGDSFTLPAGTYYVLGNIYSCSSSGAFSLIRL